MRLFARLKTIAVIIWAVALALLVPFFFYNYSGGWLQSVAAFWPLSRP
jgi:hypothetical protein